MTPTQGAAKIRRSTKTVERAVQAGTLPATKEGNRIVISRDSLNQWATRRGLGVTVDDDAAQEILALVVELMSQATKAARRKGQRNHDHDSG